MLRSILLGDDAVSVLRGLDKNGKLAELEPSLAALRMDVPSGYRHKDNLTHSLQVLENAISREVSGVDLILRTAALFHDIAKPKVRKFHEGGVVTFDNHEAVGAKMVRAILMRQGFNHAETAEIALLVALHMRSHGFTSEAWTDAGVRRLAADAGNAETLQRLAVIFYADATSKIPKKVAELHRSVDELMAALSRVAAKDVRATLRPALSGTDIMSLFGVPAGRELGDIMRFLNSEEGVILSCEDALAAVTSKFSLKSI